MPAYLESFKLADRSGLDTRKLWKVCLLATFVSVIVTFWAFLDLSYKWGGPGAWRGNLAYNVIERLLKQPAGADGTFVDFDGDGFSLQWVDGVFGGALAFDGADDWVEIPGVIVDTVDWSMGCWANPGEEQNTWANIMSSHVDFKGVSFETFDDTKNLIGVAMGNGETWGGGDFLEIAFNEWNHMVYTRSGDQAIWYLNGEIDSETTLDSDDPVVATTENFRLGNWILGGKGRVWNGSLDEGFIFERALSQDEIRDIMNNGVSGTATAVNPADKTSVTWGQIKSQY